MLQSFGTKFQIFLVAALLFLLISCSDSDQVKVLYGTKEDIMTMLQSDDITQRASINSNSAIFYTEKGGQNTMNTNNLFVFEENGNTVTGMIDFEVLELYTKS